MSHSNCLLLRTIIFLSFFSFVIPQSVKAADTEGDPVDWTVRFDNSQSQWSEVYVQILSEDLMQTTGDFKGNKMKDIGGGIFEYQFRWTYGKALIGFNSSAVLSPFQGAVLSEWAGVPMYYDSKGYLGKEQTYTFCFSDDFAWSDKSAITAKMFDDADGYWVDHTGSDGLLPRTCTVTRNENYYIWFSFSGVEMKNPHVLIYMESCPSNLVCAPYEDNAEYMHPTGEVTPALYENERRYSVYTLFVVYALFILGILMSYYVLFPISFRFLGTYSVAEKVHSTITLDSYISTFTTLILLMGVVFQLPVIAYALGKMGLITSRMLSRYRKHAFMVIMVVAAAITPPDLMTLVLVTIPLYLLYEVSIMVVRS